MSIESDADFIVFGLCLYIRANGGAVAVDPVGHDAIDCAQGADTQGFSDGNQAVKTWLCLSPVRVVTAENVANL